MAYIRKENSKWRAEVVRLGVRTSRSFATKSAATQWAAAEETAILSGTNNKFPSKTLDQALTQYELKVSCVKRGGVAEAKRFGALRRNFPELCARVMHTIKTDDLAAWRDTRLASVSKSSVQRDINLLRNVWTVAANEWKWCEAPGPWKGLRTPGDNHARDRRVNSSEIKLLVRWAGYQTNVAPKTKTCEAAWAFMLGLRTAMRAGELMGLELRDVDLAKRVVTLRNHKTMEVVGTRFVPLTKQGTRLLAVLCAQATAENRASLFTMSAAQLDANWRKLKGNCGIEGLHFHDSRAEALTLLARRMDVMTLARISGHRDINILLNTYYRERADQIAARL